MVFQTLINESILKLMLTFSRSILILPSHLHLGLPKILFLVGIPVQIYIFIVQEIPENGGDVAHLNAIHGPSLLAGSDLRFSERIIHRFARHVWSAQWQPHESKPYNATMHLHHEVRIFNKIPLITMDVRAEQVISFCMN